MSFPNVVFEVLLREVRLTAPALRRRGSRHLLNADLVWPRPLIARRNAVREIEFERGRCDLTAFGWHGRALFKERVQGRFSLGLVLSEAVGDAAMQNILRTAASQSLRQSADNLAELSPFSFLAAFGATPFSVLARSLSGKGEPAVMGSGFLDLDSSNLDTGEPTLRSVTLTASTAITATVRRSSGGGTSRPLRRELVPAGAEFAQVDLEIMPAW